MVSFSVQLAIYCKQLTIGAVRQDSIVNLSVGVSFYMVLLRHSRTMSATSIQLYVKMHVSKVAHK